MEFVMSNKLNFPIKYEYSYVTPGDYVETENHDLSYRYASALNMGYEIEAGVIKVLVDTSKVTNMSNMFEKGGLKSVLLFDTSKVVDMKYMFHGCSRLSYVPLLDTSKVTNMYMMFSSCTSLTSIPQLDTSNVAEMEAMFSGCTSLITIPQLDTSNVTTMGSMFSGSTKLTSIPLLDCGSVSTMSNMFGYSNINSITDLGGFKDLGKQSSVSGISSGFLDRVPNLTHESLMNVINNLYDRKSNGLSNMSIKFGTDNLNKLTDEEKAIAINKGWNLS